MLPSRAIKAFLARKRFDYSWYKNLTDAELEERKRKLPARPPIWEKLRKEQKACFLLGAKFRRFSMFMDTGLGKSLLSIALIRYFASQDEVNCALVLVPNKINCSEWADQIREHSPDTKFCILTGSSEEKWNLFNNSDALIFVGTYAGVYHMCCNRADVVDKNGKLTGKQKLKLHPTAVKHLCKRVDGLILDESDAVANKGTLPFRLARQLVKQSNLVLELTGTPFGRDPTALWSQMFLVDDGWSLGETLELFRAAFFKTKINYWGGYEHTFEKRMADTLHKFIAHRSIRYEADESTLPELVYSTKMLGLGGEAQAYYEKAKEALIAARGNFRELKNVFVRMRQISSGFVGYADDELGIRAKLEFPDNPKLDTLLSMIGEIRTDRKILVFHDFVFSGSMIQRELTKAGVSHVRLMPKDKDPGYALDRFKRDPDCRVFILSSAGAYGLNLQVAQYAIFYESPVRVIIRKQMIRRLHRQHSAHERVFLTDLVMRGTADEKILAYHAEGGDLMKAIVDGTSEL